MANIVKSPICDFRAMSYPAAGVKATATTTAPSAPTVPTGNNNAFYLVVQDISARMVAGTSAETPIRINLIDGTTGGTNIVWSGVAASAAGSASSVDKDSLNIPCKSGFATLEFVTAGGTTSQQIVSMGGYYGGGYGS